MVNSAGWQMCNIKYTVYKAIVWASDIPDRKKPEDGLYVTCAYLRVLQVCMHMLFFNSQL